MHTMVRSFCVSGCFYYLFLKVDNYAYNGDNLQMLVCLSLHIMVFSSVYIVCIFYKIYQNLPTKEA